MKQFNPTQKTINGNKFFIRPFPAFKCAYISGEVFSFIMPLASSLIPVAMEATKNESESILDFDVSKVAPALLGGSNISGRKLESFLQTLLTDYKNISVELDGENEAQLLTEDIANEIFCMGIEDMIVLAFEVVKVNFPGIFKKLGDLFGQHLSGVLEALKVMKNTANSTRNNSQS